nr:type II toxin-antitoxin system YoeB family toxin [uncultured Shuttleworthia sp.]
MTKAWTDDAWNDFEYWTKQDKKTMKRIGSSWLTVGKKVRSAQ